jgi:ABC-type transport system involved in multi-copper enzyme maturation permease subunit
MAVILHILKRDLRASWIFLCVMMAFLVLRVVQLWPALSQDYFSGAQHFPFSMLNPIVLYLILVPIIVRLIHEDSLVGTSAFWMTRPISRNSLLLAKGLFVFLFLVVVPLAANIVLLFHFGMKSSQALPFLLTILAIHLAIICVFASLAVVTPNWSHFVAAAIAAVAYQFVANNWCHRTWCRSASISHSQNAALSRTVDRRHPPRLAKLSLFALGRIVSFLLKFQKY